MIAAALRAAAAVSTVAPVETAAAATTGAAVQTATAGGPAAAKAIASAAETVAGAETIATVQRSLKPPLAEVLRKGASGAVAVALAVMPLLAAVAAAAASGKRPGGSVARIGRGLRVMRAAAVTGRLPRGMQLEMRTSRVVCSSGACSAGHLGEKAQLRSLCLTTSLTVSLKSSPTFDPTLPRVVARTAAEVAMGAAEVLGAGLLAMVWHQGVPTQGLQIRRSRIQRCALNLICIVPML